MLFYEIGGYSFFEIFSFPNIEYDILCIEVFINTRGGGNLSSEVSTSNINLHAAKLNKKAPQMSEAFES